MDFYKINQLNSKERKEMLNLTEYYAKMQLTERALLKVLEQTLPTVLSRFLSGDFLELINDFRAGKTPLLLFQGELFDKSMPLSHTKEFVGTKVLMPQEVFAMIISVWVGYVFTLWGENRPQVIQRGAKLVNNFGPSVAGQAERGFHVDNPQLNEHLADFLFFLLNNSNGVNTRFSTVSVEKLDKNRVGNYTLLEFLKQFKFGTRATLERLGKEERIHPIIANSEYEYPEIIFNENTVYKPSNQLINTEIPDKWTKLALENFGELLKEYQIDVDYNFALVNQKQNQSVLHAVQEIPSYRQKEICADPNKPEYLWFRELIRVYISRLVSSRNWVKNIDGLEQNDGTYTNVVV